MLYVNYVEYNHINNFVSLVVSKLYNLCYALMQITKIRSSCTASFSVFKTSKPLFPVSPHLYILYLIVKSFDFQMKIDEGQSEHSWL